MGGHVAATLETSRLAPTPTIAVNRLRLSHRDPSLDEGQLAACAPHVKPQAR